MNSYSNIRKVLGANVKFYRYQNGFTQEQLAEKCDLHRTYIGAVERGDRNVSLQNIAKIAAALNTTPSKLLEAQMVMEGNL